MAVLESSSVSCAMSDGEKPWWRSWAGRQGQPGHDPSPLWPTGQVLSLAGAVWRPGANNQVQESLEVSGTCGGAPRELEQVSVMFETTHRESVQAAHTPF